MTSTSNSDMHIFLLQAANYCVANAPVLEVQADLQEIVTKVEPLLIESSLGLSLQVDNVVPPPRNEQFFTYCWPITACHDLSFNT